MAVDSKLVRELRDMSGAGMMDCKKALESTGGDVEAALDELRKKGLKSAEKKASREMGEGRVVAHIADDGKTAAMVAMTCETDFVPNTPDFEAFISTLLAHVHERGPSSVEELLGQDWTEGGTVEEALKGLIGKLGENMSIQNCARLETSEGRIGVYIHHDNKKGALAAVRGAQGSHDDFLKDLCMHIVFNETPYLQRDEVPQATLDRERQVALESDEMKKKPEEIREKIITGKLEKFVSGLVLPEQPWIRDDKQSVTKAIESTVGGGSAVECFAYFKVGA